MWNMGKALGIFSSMYVRYFPIFFKTFYVLYLSSVLLINTEVTCISWLLTSIFSWLNHTYSSSPPSSVVSLSMVSVTQPTMVQKYEVENSRGKQSISFKLCTILSSTMKSNAVLLHPAQNMNHPFIQHLHTVYSSCPLGIW